jgi:hypothetical protein
MISAVPKSTTCVTLPHPSHQAEEEKSEDADGEGKDE